MASVSDVAKYIVERQQGTISTLKLQKLVYYSQAWSLVWDEKPLFVSPIEAWANGPVIPDLYDLHRGFFTAHPDMFKGDSSCLTDAERETIDVVLGAYADLSGQQLSDLSHSERPWREAREGVPEGAKSGSKVSLDVMQEYYSGIHAASAD
ncbi:prophage ps3 protein 01 [Corynebacterium phocae]|uniref:Prophage ps3 protein 01 n=1 Tax=Corynebacterium phocae TaxID=161895 RepID=A0A1L7D6J6_9CORY|nr:type II toxin-antitoxin system antitoxin SocA domain-containing protein [Corynebacterium phocae]APT93764.1 prophage ps3 protein 01 [Corynebacterium phocae]KAA8723334.1 DUF4065 domain-containing protein [Corynebacterium phocae]